MEYALSQQEMGDGAMNNVITSFFDSRLYSYCTHNSMSFYVSVTVTKSQHAIFAFTVVNSGIDALSFSVDIGENVLGTYEPEISSLANSGTSGILKASIDIPLASIAQQNSEVIYITTTLNDERIVLHSLSKYLLQHFYRSLKHVASFMPSRGFFGGINHSPLTVEVNKKITTIVLCNEKDNAYVNFTSLRIYNAQNEVIPKTAIQRVSASSNVSKSDLSASIAAGKGFHSKKETCPYLIIELEQPTIISKVEVVNRRDKWGSRAQNLSVLVTLESHRILPVYAMQSSYSVERDVIILDEIYRNSLNKDTPFYSRQSLLNLLLESYEQKLEVLRPADFDVPLQLLSTWNETYKLSDETLHRLELMLLALFVVVSTRKSLTLSLHSFSRLLERDCDIAFLENAINEYRSKVECSPIKLTKHGAARQGVLVSNTDTVLTALDEVMQDLSACGYKPCLAYGTLLGAKRENAFIPPDDDVDILIDLSVSDLEEKSVKPSMEALIEQLDPSKYRISKGSKTTTTHNIHVFHKKTNIMIDIFPYWFNGDSAFLHMEKMKVRGIPKDILSSRTTTSLYNKEYPVPGRIVDFLKERYGDAWSVSDRFHEWPWPVRVTEGSNYL